MTSEKVSVPDIVFSKWAGREEKATAIVPQSSAYTTRSGYLAKNNNKQSREFFTIITILEGLKGVKTGHSKTNFSESATKEFKISRSQGQVNRFTFDWRSLNTSKW